MSAPGYVQPSLTQSLPHGLSLDQFLQSVLVGLSNLNGTLVRPNWQAQPPKSPTLETNWLAFGVITVTPDANSYVGVDSDGLTVTQRHEALEIGCSIYGPNGMDIAGLIRDGFQIEQNRNALKSANMGFVETSPVNHVPDLLNERFVQRVQMSIILRREIQRIYPLLTLLSATGQIHTVLGNEEYLLAWQTQT